MSTNASPALPARTRRAAFVSVAAPLLCAGLIGYRSLKMADDALRGETKRLGIYGFGAAAQADFVVTIVGFPADVEQTYFGPQGVLPHAKRGAVLIDMTTSSPALARRWWTG